MQGGTSSTDLETESEHFSIFLRRNYYCNYKQITLLYYQVMN